MVTVIVPVYNVRDYLQQCLQSIAAQTYAQLEVIVVDDGSTDGSGALADQWAERDARFRVVHQENAGLSAARNTALNLVSGHYITFVDSDDFIAPQFVESLLHVIEESGAQVAICGWHDYTDGAPVPKADGPCPVTVYAAEEATDHILYQRHALTHSAWGRLFCAEVFQKVRFPEGLLYEDLAVLMPVMECVTTVVYTAQRLYYYRQRPGSILATFNVRRAHVLDILEDLESRAPFEFPQHLKAIRSRLLSAYFNMLRLASPQEVAFAHITDRSWQGVKRLRWSCFFDSNVRFRNKAGVVLSFCGRAILTRALRMF